MKEIRSPVWYKRFQRFALVLAIVLLVIGFAFNLKACVSAGLIIGAHGLVALLILLIEERRIVSADKVQEPSE